MYLVEPGNPNANIKNLDDAFWWAVITVSTVGYGDVYPVTSEGRIIATLTMFAGIGILGTFISTIGARLISEKLKQEAPTVVDDTKRVIKSHIDRIEQLDHNEFDLLIQMMREIYSKKKN